MLGQWKVIILKQNVKKNIIKRVNSFKNVEQVMWKSKEY